MGDLHRVCVRVNKLKSIENKGCFKLAVKADVKVQVPRQTMKCIEIGCYFLVLSPSFPLALAAVVC